VLVGRACGAGDRPGVLRAARMGFFACIALTLTVAVIVGVWAGAVAGFYTTDPMLRALVTGALVLATLFFVADGLQVVAAQALRSRGDVWVPTATHVASYALVMAPLGWALAHPAHLGLNGIVWAILVASLLSAGLLLSRFYMLARREL
jgi:MATE family multidrug resistance protein